MKQLLFLLLFPAYAMAQYPGNAGQKITLGEQTTADGLVYRGVAADTTLTVKSDTAAYFVLDTVNLNLYTYKASASGRKWRQLGADTAAIAYVNTYGTQTVNGAKTFTSAVTATKLNVTDSIQSNSGIYKINSSTLGLNVDNTTPFRITNTGNWGIYNDNPQNLLSSFSSSARGGVISNTYPILMFNEDGNSKFVFGLDGNEGYLWGFPDVKLRIATNNTEKMRIETNGNVGIGTTAPLALLNVMGTLRINSASAPDANYYLQLENSASQKAKANAWDTYSDKRIKTDIQPIVNAIDKVNLLNPVYYQKHDSYVENDFLNIDFDSSVKSLGFIAQEVYNVIPEAVNTGTTNELWAMDYTKIIPILTKAIQEQQALIKALEQRIINLENK